MAGRESEGDQGRGGCGGGGGEVAENSGHRFVADTFGRGFGGEVDAFDDGVGLEDDPLAWDPEVEQSAVVTRSRDDALVGGEVSGEAGNEIELFHLGRAGGTWGQGDDPEEVGGIEEGVTEDGGGDVAGFFIQPRPKDSQQAQGEEGSQIGVDQGEQERDDEATQHAEAPIPEGRPEDPSKDQFLEDRRGARREEEQQTAFPGAGGTSDCVHGGLGIRRLPQRFK